MRDFFIKAFEILVVVIIVLLALGVLVGAGLAVFGGRYTAPGGLSGALAGLAILVGGAIYVVFIAGLMYLGLGIYQNTKRTAAAVEKLAVGC